MSAVSSLKRVVIGRPRANRELKHQLLPKWMALPVFSSDPLSSVAYATEEMMLVLALAGAAAFSFALPLAFGVATLLTIVIISYRQTVRAYPHGGGAYIVARENIGDVAGLTAAAALLIDYTLTVSVSIAAGVAAISSAYPPVAANRVPVALGFVALVTLANLRGVKEAGALFAFPTYLFVATMFTMIVTGLVKCVGGCPPAPVLGEVHAEHGLTLFLLLRAFSSGSTALTGVEAISNGVPAFRYPQSKNAATTLAVMGFMAVTMFIGISFLATSIPNVVAFEGMERTVNSQIAAAIFGEGAIGFYLVQGVTAAILILAANTAYADFPRLGSVLASDRFLPRQLLARGDRLVFSNGIVVLTGLAMLLLVAFSADVTRLIQLYVVGVFTSFTLSQWGMVRHWLKTREAGWRRSAIVNGVGGTTTGIVLVVVAMTKFLHGAWIVIVAIPVVVWIMHRIHRHYSDVALELRAGIAEPELPHRTHAVVLLDRVDASVARALGYAIATETASISAIAIGVDGYDVRAHWNRLAPQVPLEVVSGSGQQVDELVERVTRVAGSRTPGHTSAIVAERQEHDILSVMRRHRVAVRLKSRLVGAGITVTNVTAADEPGAPVVQEPVSHHVVVLVSAVHKGTMRALAYAQGLSATSTRALYINLDSEGGHRVLAEWSDWDIQMPLELQESPYRTLGATVLSYVRAFEPDGERTVVTCVIPEFVLSKWLHRPLHNQTALALKAALLTEPGVVVTSVPYRVRGSAEGFAAPDGEQPYSSKR